MKGQLIKVTGIGFVRVPKGASKEVIIRAANKLAESKEELAAIQDGAVDLEGNPVPVPEEPAEDVEEEPVEKVKGLLELIMDTETDEGYNSLVGGGTHPFDEMTYDEVMDYQKKEMTKAKGFPSSAVGGYQFILDTTAYLKKRMKLTGDEPFTPELQDEMALNLLQRRGLSRWDSGELSDEGFATNIAKEWASFPVVQPATGKVVGESYHKHVGGNKALVDVETVMDTLENQRNLPILPEKEVVLEEVATEDVDNFEVPTPDLAESLMAQETASEEVPVEPMQSPTPEENVPPTTSQELPAPPKTLQEAAINKIPEDLVASAHPKTGNPTIVGQSKDPMPSLDEAIRDRLG